MHTFEWLQDAAAIVVGSYFAVRVWRFAKPRRGSGDNTDPRSPLELVAQGKGPEGFDWKEERHPEVATFRIPASWRREESSPYKTTFIDPLTESTVCLELWPGFCSRSQLRLSEQLIANLKSDTPGHRVTRVHYGTLDGVATTRILGVFFDPHGIDHYTRAYLLFVAHTAVVLIARTPNTERQHAALVVDAMAKHIVETAKDSYI